MKQAVHRATSTALFVLSLAGALPDAQTTSTPAPERDEQAVSVLKRMADYLSQA